MTTLRDIQIELYNIETSTPRMAARELAAKFADVEIIEAPTQDRAIISCPECFVEVKWMNRKHSAILAYEATCPEF